ncbi:hypothetical protein TNCV_2118231 [Trichonephila clavipes]|nr:hypothetical protein TNCV_2118231 [Trichonephila clavipes]
MKIAPLAIPVDNRPGCLFRAGCGSGSLVVKETGSWPPCHEFVPLTQKIRRAKVVDAPVLKKSDFPSPNLVDIDDTLTEFNAEPSLWEGLPEQDLMFDDYVLVDTDIAVWGALSDAEIVALEHHNTENDEEESKELTPVTLSEAKVSLNKLRNFSLQNHVDADILQASFVLEKSIDKYNIGRIFMLNTSWILLGLTLWFVRKRYDEFENISEELFFPMPSDWMTLDPDARCPV